MKTATFGALGLLMIAGCSAPEVASPEVSPTPSPSASPVATAKPVILAPASPSTAPTPKATFDAEFAIQQEQDARERAKDDAKAEQDTRDMLASQRQQREEIAVSGLRSRIARLQSQKEQTRNLSERDDIDRQIQALERQIDEQRAAP